MHQNTVQVGEGGPGVHVEAELLFKVMAKANLWGGRGGEGRGGRGGGGRGGEGEVREDQHWDRGGGGGVR